MGRISVFEEQRRIQASRGMDADDVEFGNVFDTAINETLRTLPTQSLMRGARNLFDSSEPLSAAEANSKFNLQGEAAFTDDDDITMDVAAERAEDQARLARNEYIQGLYAQENPGLSTLANITGSLAAGFMDPALMALNVGASVAMTRGLSAMANTRVGTNAINAVGNFNPTMGKALIQMYDLKAQQSLTSVIMREGAENVLASTLEESINFAGVGENRLARDVSAQESLRNIIIGSAIGTGLGTGLDRAARAGMFNRFSRMFGDKAAEVVDVQQKIVQLETDAGVTPDISHVAKQVDEEMFDAKPWHDDTEATIIDSTETPADTEFYIPKDGDTFKSVSNRGSNVVLTNNAHHAKNLGKQVDKVKLNEDANILTPEGFKEDTFLKRSIAEDMAADLTEHIDGFQARAIIAKLYDVDPFEVEDIEFDEIFQVLADEIDSKEGLEEMMEFVEELSTAAEIETFHHDIIQNVLEASGYDGYTFRGTGMAGDNKYTGLALTESGRAKITKTGESEVREPTFKEKQEHNLRKAKEAQDYADNLEKRARQAATEQDIKEMLGENVELAENETLEDAYVTNERVKQNVDERYEDLKSMEKLSEEEELELENLEALKQGKRVEDVLDENVQKVETFKGCMLGEDVETPAPNYAPEDIEF